MRRRTAAAAVLLLAVAASAAATSSGGARQTLQAALRFFREADATHEHNTSHMLYRQALLRFQRLIRRDGVRNGKIFYDLGNTYYRLGDIGRAILSYRRAQLYLPADPNLEHNLSYVRSKRVDRLPVSSEASLLRVLFFWHYDLQTSAQGTILAVSFGVISLLLGLLALLRRRWVLWPLAGVGLIFVVFLGSLAWTEGELATHHAGVIVAAKVTARKGDALSYDPAFKGPLHAGTEFQLISARPDWYHVELSDGTTAWIPQSSARLVRPVG